MNIIVLGAGGIGSLVGALLSKKNNVTLIGRETHVNAINKSGLIITGCINNTFNINAQTKITEIKEKTLIILTTKVTNSEKSISEIKNKISNDTIILCLQNGLGSEDIVKKIVKCKVLRAIITAGTTFLEDGKVHCSNLGEIYIADSKESQDIVSVLKKSGLKAEISNNIKERIWKKLIINCVMNTLSAIFQVKNGELIKAKNLIKPVIDEILIVAESEKIKFANDEIFKMVMEAIKNSAENKSSMFQDIIKKRKTEIDFLNGKVVELAEKKGIHLPLNKALVEIIKFIENGTKNTIT